MVTLMVLAIAIGSAIFDRRFSAQAKEWSPLSSDTVNYSNEAGRSVRTNAEAALLDCNDVRPHFWLCLAPGSDRNANGRSLWASDERDSFLARLKAKDSSPIANCACGGTDSPPSGCCATPAADRSDGKLIGDGGTLVDISDRKRAEEDC